MQRLNPDFRSFLNLKLLVSKGSPVFEGIAFSNLVCHKSATTYIDSNKVSHTKSKPVLFCCVKTRELVL